MATSIPANPTTQTINQLLVKLNDNDPDFRFMSLSDLITVLNIGKHDLLHHDYNTAARTIDSIVKSLDDQNGEVQNQAIKCLGPLVAKIPHNLIAPLIEKLSTLKLQNSVDNSVPALALRNVIESLPRPVQGVVPSREVLESYASISRVLIPRLLGRSIQAQKATGNVRLPAPGDGMIDSDQDLNADAVDVLIEVVRCFGPMLQPVEIEALQDAVIGVLENHRATSVVRKRAVVAISILAVYLSDDLLLGFIKRTVVVLGNPKVNSVTKRFYVTIMGSMARSVPYRFGQHIHTVVPFVLSALGENELQQHLEEINDGVDSGPEFNEVREAALVALEAFLASCPSQMRAQTDEVITSCLRYLKYDPNYAVDDDDEDMEEDEEDDADELEDDDEFETGDGFDDDDDASWKVRRCAAKALYTLVSTRSSGDLLDNGVLYGQVAPALIKRFDEREENVRLEVVSTLSLLIRKTGEGVIPDFALDNGQAEDSHPVPVSRKRRRQSSGGGPSALHLTGTGLTSPTLERIPSTGPRADLAQLTPNIIKGSTKLLKGKSVPAKQAATNLLDDLITVQQGGLADYFDQVIELIIEAIKPSSASSTSVALSGAGGNASATPATLRVAALRLMSDIAKTHSSKLLQPYLTKIVAGVVAVVHDRFYKISSQAIQTVEEIVKAITPPRSRATAQKYKAELAKLYDVLVDRTVANDADVEVRQRAIHALGTLLSRTISAEGAGLLAADKRQKSLDILSDRLKNETTRISAVRAIDSVAAVSSSNVQLDSVWVREVALELSGQLRKANRALRGSSVQALKHLILSPASEGALDKGTVKNLVLALQPVITNNDAHLLGPTLHILAYIVEGNADTVVTPTLIDSLCQLLLVNIVDSVLDPLLDLVTKIGQIGAGEPLMSGLLRNVGVSGDPATVGKVIGTLLVGSGGSAGVTLDSFISEADTTEDPLRASLALSVLGEAGLRLGQKSPLEPQLFLDKFGKEYDKVSLSAALALGRAGAGNVPQYLPMILKNLEKTGTTQYLLLQSIKEILLQDVDIAQYSSSIWSQLLDAAGVDDNKAVCAECIGRLAIIDPKTYIPKLDGLLKDNSATLRAIAVQALRYTLPESTEQFDSILQNYLVSMLMTMLQDSDMDIRRLAMSTLNSAAHNKPDMILGHLGQLMPYVMQESVIKPELRREVQMGPFKHLVDDGLEVRKSAYETLYALMETAFSRISIIELYDRIIAGLKDDNDIRSLSNLMVSKLVYIDPDETVRRLDAIADAYRTTLSTKLKENAVKQEHEKQEEANKSVLRVTLLLGEKLKGSVGSSSTQGAAGANQVWGTYWDWVNKDFNSQLKSLREESDRIGHTYA